MSTAPRLLSARFRRLGRLVVLPALLSLCFTLRIQAAQTGLLTGTVSNTATGNLLEGAKVELPQLGLSALVDNTGRYVLAGVPPGTHDVTVSYIGLDAMRQQVTV